MPGVKKKNGQTAPAVPLQPVPMPMPHVKVFRLNDEHRWDDCGEGHVMIDYLEGSKGEVVLAVLDAEDDETMLLHVITRDDIYRKQEETFISWCDPDAGMQLSLSFQDTAACSQVWYVTYHQEERCRCFTVFKSTLDMVCKVQRKQRLGPCDSGNDAPPS
ncbi:suppressor of Mek1 isoform X1 [Brachypodium distachyon]|uniref:suppressor of Mek1 isoform X1 n=1 Tax=Brachypodium distachyon TaxID=15368 RepID=UPI000D0D4FE7|nr:suppressor of Mek1 isoform X1 [Brachypodium distachyon]|eukprot:XP_024313511.1 suppressor of Mek1 isoform X1 [Brachypodium distachyon]